MPKFFWYERSSLAKWSPCAASEKPGDRISKGPKRSPVHELKPDEEALSLRLLSKLYPPPVDEATNAPTRDPTLDEIAEAVSDRLKAKLSQT
ncbi:hypothetical protein [Paracoccus phage vB_PmaS-R3]|uniref:Uncharacterized protein n=1 Tax=Paracoccus phage vB_PmaS-R3 TaxID=2494563 RepID=A0A0B5A2I4_9CAUD|nr:hypothetical protein VC48_gp24 [Paracoccus phage vB_PmaS-R3]AJD83148.1 hypothetical protein [Paracoccus phage vB_PmaS-R3]